jgi:hypothetical protein
MSASLTLKQLCLEKLFTCEFDKHSLPQELQKDFRVIEFAGCLMEIHCTVQQYESEWNNWPIHKYWRMYSNAKWQMKWSWVCYCSLDQMKKRSPTVLACSSYHMSGYNDYIKSEEHGDKRTRYEDSPVDWFIERRRKIQRLD